MNEIEKKYHKPNYYEIFVRGRALAAGEKPSIESLLLNSKETNGQKSKYVDVKMTSLEEEYMGMKVASGEVNTKVFFNNQDQRIFDMIAEDIAAGKFVPLASEPSTVKLTERYLKGIWKTKVADFFFNLVETKPDGTTGWMMARSKDYDKDGRTIPSTKRAEKNSVKIFIPYESEESMSEDYIQMKLDQEITKMKRQAVKDDIRIAVEDSDVIEDIVTPAAPTAGTAATTVI